MRVFDLELDPAHVEAIAADGERRYPDEACGVVLGPPGATERVVPLANVQDRYHARDPARFPRTARDAFRIDELERMRALDAAPGLAEHLIYHSHPDAGAYFSPEDRAAAIFDGIELSPGAIHVVVSVREGRRREMAAYRYDASTGAFDEQRIPLAVARGLPDLELRAMEGRESSRPVAPVGHRLGRRVLAPTEAEPLARLAERKIPLDPRQLATLERLAGGLLSPLTGFLRGAELESIRAHGRLLSGTPWRAEVELVVKAAPIADGAIVELVDGAGVGRAVMGVGDREERGTRMRLGGPVYVYPPVAVDAAERRAEILRRGWSRVLAIPRGLEDPGRPDEFDGFLVAEPMGPRELPGPPEAEGWLVAAMAQNLGATDILVDDPSLASRIAESLAIRPWRAEA